MEKYKLETNEYGNVVGIPEGWIQSKLTISQLKKAGIPHYKACIDFDKYRSNYYPIIKNIIPKDFKEKEQNYLNNKTREKEEKNKKLIKEKYTLEILGECLYSINKEAKKQRDIQNNAVNDIYGSGERYLVAPHHILHTAKDKKKILYDLKEIVIEKIIKEHKIKSVGYHEFKDCNRDMYIIGEFEFHINENNSKNCLGSIDNLIESERKRSIPPKKAMVILLDYIKENNKKYNNLRKNIYSLYKL